ncbi:MAG: CRISPR-associated endonuclease Cas1 [Candidatus Scalindua rubra]|uniref:CRISPR-associated endonuclease Cas1 n=1 Tax=Candidatus Scalindua brodae TaxID=237368 RepID=A0A0B0EEW2_9BACT|nr:MAG: CRISPR-associated protein [Candidatus Scalindua brodae]MBZ0110086.1 CRISPR-associated endonuclease Cas1 [Candidatus Scalindua rubra]
MTTDTLLEQFLSKSNFISAYERIASKKAAGGLDNVTVESFGNRLDQHISKLQKEIMEHRYVPKPLKSIHVPKYNKENEWRGLALPSVSDKVVQAALLQVVEPLGEKLFMDSSYAYRKGKGHYKAIRRVEHCLGNRKKSWVVHRDIDNFFDTLNYDRLIDQFSALVDGEPVMTELVALWCRTGLVEAGGRWRGVQSGIRQGNIISPLLSNLYLHPLDEFAARLRIDWVRYCDDYLILCDSRKDAISADRLIKEYLKEPLCLKLNNSGLSPCHIDEGFTFLGVSFRGKGRSIASEKLEKMKKKMGWFLSDKSNGSPEEIITKLTEKVQGWKRHYGFLNPTEQFSQLDKIIEEKFVKLAASRIKAGLWDTSRFEGLSFPALINSSSGDRLKKLKGLLQKIVSELKTEALNKVQSAVDTKVERGRRRYNREHGQDGYLIVTTPGHFVGKRGERIVVRYKQKIISDLPVIQLKGLTLSGRGTSISGDVIALCMKRGINIHFVDDNIGKITAIVSPPGGSSGEVSLLQITERDKESGLELAKMFILGKVKNQFALLKYYFKYPLNQKNGYGKTFTENRHYLSDLIDKIKKTTGIYDPDAIRQRLMGLEGAFGATYWAVIKHLFRNEVTFSGRDRFGANDVVNSALNYGYGILYGECLSAVIRAGLNPMAGFLHSYQSGKPTLTYDLIEEFRSFVVDRGIFAMFNRGERLENGEDGLLTLDARKKIIKSVIGRLSSEVWFKGRRVTLQEVIREQAVNIKKHLTGKVKYRPFLGRW